MAAPTYSEDLTDVTLAEVTTGWSAYGGGASGLSASPDISMEGTNCVDKNITGAGTDKGQYFDNGSGITLGTGDHVFIWHFCSTPGLVDSIASKGSSVLVGTGSGAYCQYHVAGNDTYGAQGRVARCYPIDYTNRNTNGSSPYRTATGSPGANPQIFGGGLVTTATVKGANCGIDAIRYGTGAFIYNGELISAGDGTDNPATFAGFAAQSDLVTQRWGLLTDLGGGTYEMQGKFVIGQDNTGTATACKFKDSNKTISIADTIHAAATFNEIIIDHASSRVEWDNINIVAQGTTAPGALTVTSNDPPVIINGGTWQGIGATTLRSNCSLDGVTWLDSDQITANGATMLNSSISGYEYIESPNIDIAALVWDTADNPNGLLDGSSFTKGSTPTHAIEFGTTSPLSMTLTDINFSGYSGSDGQLDSALWIRRTSGTVNITISGGTTPSYKSDGATVNIISGSVNVAVNVKDTATPPVNIQNARVILQASDATGPFPYQESVTIANSGTTATVTHTAHGMATNDKVLIAGASHQENNGVFQITVTGANTYTYTMGSAPGSSPTGTITSTFVALEGLTDASGNISTSRVYASNQPVSGRARKSSGSPYYKTSNIVGTVSNTAGFSATVQLLPDE